MLKTIQEAVKANENCGCNNTSDINKASISKVEGPSKGKDVSMTTSDTEAASRINKAITESPDLIKALESVGAMYGIPSTHIISDDCAKSIKVVNDNIIAPPLPNPIKYNKHIIQAVGGVLDYISQRIDDKLNEYQMNNIHNGRVNDLIKNADPNKGNCIGVYDDDNGEQILAYDTGIVDAPNTPAARMKIDELRANETIPTFDPSANRQSDIPGLSYFTDEDDISADVDMDATSDGNPDEVTTECNDVAKKIQESAYHVNLCSKYGNTTHLGYDMLRRHGFDFVKPMDSVVMESKTEEVEDDVKKKKKVRASDIKHLKFDNTKILEAVEYFNKAREEQENAKKMKLDEFINDPNFEKGISCLNKQFNCRINLRFMKTRGSSYENCGTEIWTEIKKKLTISKSKGFQLGGLPIDIFVYNHFFESNAPKDICLFGQNMVSIICHEIFHNISVVMRMENAKNNMSLAMTLDLASSAKTVKEKRIIITNYVDTMENICGNKLFNNIAKKKLIKSLTALTMVPDNTKVSKEIKDATANGNDPDKYIDELIKRHKQALRHLRTPSKRFYIFGTLVTAGCIIGGVLGPANLMIPLAATGISAGMTTLSMVTYDMGIKALNKQYDSKKIYEEYYCDLFAGMYQLPIFFFVGKEKYTPNDFNQDKLNTLADLERKLYKALYATYPTDLERCHAAVRIAEDLLKQDNLDPNIKKYCEWIVDNFSNVKNTNIDTMYNKTTYNPKEAEDLDKHLETLITDNNITLTESFIQWLRSDDIIV